MSTAARHAPAGTPGPATLPPAAPPAETPSAETRSLAEALGNAVRGEVRFDAGTRALYAATGSNYRQTPIVVVVPRDIDDLIAVRAAESDTLIVADGFSCREHIAQLTDRRALHTAEVLHLAMRAREQRDRDPRASAAGRADAAAAPVPSTLEATIWAGGGIAVLTAAAASALWRARGLPGKRGAG